MMETKAFRLSLFYTDAQVVAEGAPQPLGRHFVWIYWVVTVEWLRRELRNHLGVVLSGFVT